MSQIKGLFIILVCIGLAACATTAKYRIKLNQWHGRTIQEFENHWGYPNKTMKLNNHQTAYIYSNQSIQSIPATRTPSYTNVSTGPNGQVNVTQTDGAYFGGQTFSLNCTTWIITNSKGRIINTSFRGNNCVSN